MTYEKTRIQTEKLLKESDNERRVLQDKLNVTEGDLDAAVLENLKLKGLNFDLDYKINQYGIIAEQLQKKLKIMNDKQSKILRDLEQASSM